MKSFMVAAVAVLAGGVIAIAQGCSSDSNGQQPVDAGEGGAIEAGTDDGAADAGPDINQPPDIYPAQHQPIPQMKNVGGTVLKNMELVTVTFTGDVKRDSVRAFSDKIISSFWWKAVMPGFGVDVGTSGGHAELPDTFSPDAGVSVTITDDQIQQILQKAITDGTVPRPTQGKTAYAFYFVKSVTIQKQNGSSCQAFGGYHNSFSVNVPPPSSDAGADGGPPGGTFDVPYAIMPRCDDFGTDVTANFNELTVTASHEFAEMASDPYVGGGAGGFVLIDDDSWLPPFYPPGSIIENGDACSDPYHPNNEAFSDPLGYTVQRIWSNAAAAASTDPCEPAPSSKPIYFAAAVRTTKGNYNGKQTFGYITVPKGGSVDAVINVFSKAELPHDLLLYVGKDKSGATDPSDMTKVSNNLTITLSQQRANNGDGVIMHIEASDTSRTGAGGDQRIVVRAVLENNNYNDWPVIIRVK